MSRARTLASGQSIDPDSVEPARVFGRSSLVLLGRFDQSTSSWKTSQPSKTLDSSKSLLNLPRSGMTRNGIVFQRQPLAPLTGGIGSGSSPTLELEKEMLPTPQSRDHKGSPGIGSKGKGGRRSSLPVWVKENSGPGPMNPTFPEWLMGFPTGWTELEP